MILLVSPAKTLNEEPAEMQDHSLPRLLKESKELIKVIKDYSSEDIQGLMKVSEKIADLNTKRYQAFKTPFTLKNAKPAIKMFKGDVYVGLQAHLFNKKEMAFAQKHLRILSGLYGILKPLDLMQPYRLEMGTKLKNKKGKNLYEFWDDKITMLINDDLKESKSKVVLNLASNEYYRSIQPEKINADIYVANFKENKNGVYKFVSFSAKKARGLMSHYVIKNKIKNVEDIKDFDMEEYRFNPDLSSEKEFIFTR